MDMLFSATVSRAHHFVLPYLSLLVVRVSRRVRAVMRRPNVCLYNVIVLHPPHQPVDFNL